MSNRCIFAVELTLTEREMDALRRFREGAGKLLEGDYSLTCGVIERIIEFSYPVTEPPDPASPVPPQNQPGPHWIPPLIFKREPENPGP